MRNRLLQFFTPHRDRFGVPFTKRSYSQCGEDMIVDYVFRLRDIELPSYLDIGANHPYFLSNTAFFYEKGSSGLVVDANPDLVRDFEKARKRDVSLNVGISGEAGEMDFYIMKDNTLSTFSSKERDILVASGKEYSTSKRIKLITVSKLLEDYTNSIFPDFLSLDVEGLDMDIIQSVDFSTTWPKVICVEAADYSPIGAGKRRNDLIDLIKSRGYYEYANTNLNAIMVKNQFWFI